MNYTEILKEASIIENWGKTIGTLPKKIRKYVLAPSVEEARMHRSTAKAGVSDAIRKLRGINKSLNTKLPMTFDQRRVLNETLLPAKEKAEKRFRENLKNFKNNHAFILKNSSLANGFAQDYR